MTDNEIIKAYVSTLKEHEETINRLQAEKSNLEIELQAMRGAANSYKAENERLKEETKHFDDIGKMYSEIKAEAYKEFAENVQGEIDDAIHNNYNAKEKRVTKSKKFGIPIDAEDSYLMYCDGKIHALSGINYYIDNLLKEKVGEDNA